MYISWDKFVKKFIPYVVIFLKNNYIRNIDNIEKYSPNYIRGYFLYVIIPFD